MDAFIESNEQARFTANDLSDFTDSELQTILANSSLIVKSARVTKLLGNKKPNAAEIAIVTECRRKRQIGFARPGTSFDETAGARKASVVYTEKEITIVGAQGTELAIENSPLPILEGKARPGHDYVAAVVAANFDVVKGEVVPIRSFVDVAKYYNSDQCRVTPEGLAAVQPIISAILKKTRESLFSESKTEKGIRFFDTLNQALVFCDLTDYWALHAAIVKNVWKHVKEVSTPNGSAYGQKPIVFVKDKQQVVEKQPYGEAPLLAVKKTTPDPEKWELYRTKTGKLPFTINTPVNPISTRAVPRTFGALVLARAKHDAIFGGKKRGIGKIAQYASFAPRMGRTFRDVNLIIAMIDAACTQKERKLDVYCTKAAVPLLKDWLSRYPREIDIKFILADQKGLTDLEHVEYVGRGDAFSIIIDESLVLPAVGSDTTKKSEVEAAMSKHLVLWKKRFAGFKRYAAYTVACHPEIWDMGLSVTPLKFCHDLRAVVSTSPMHLVPGEDVLEPIESSAFLQKASNDMKVLFSWWLNPFPVYHSISMQYSLAGSNVVLSEEGEWEYKVPTRVYALPDEDKDQGVMPMLAAEEAQEVRIKEAEVVKLVDVMSMGNTTTTVTTINSRIDINSSMKVGAVERGGDDLRERLGAPKDPSGLRAESRERYSAAFHKRQQEHRFRPRCVSSRDVSPGT